MAWLAELRRRHWYKVHGIPNMVYWYSDKLYEDWWYSLTPEQQQRVEERRKQRKELEKRRAMEALYSMVYITGAIGSNYLRRM